MFRICLLAPLCAAVLVKSPGDNDVNHVVLARNPTYRLWGKVYNASYHGGEVLNTDVSEEVTTEESTEDTAEGSTEDTAEDSTEDTTQVQETQVESLDPEPVLWKEMFNCLRKKRFISCVSGNLSRHWRNVSMATGRKKALRKLYLPLLLLFFKFKLLVVVLGMVAALAGKSAIMSAVSMALAVGLAIKTSLGGHGYHNNKRFDQDFDGQTSTVNSGGLYAQ